MNINKGTTGSSSNAIGKLLFLKKTFEKEPCEYKECTS